jgi:hypothetical protein
MEMALEIQETLRASHIPQLTAITDRGSTRRNTNRPLCTSLHRALLVGRPAPKGLPWSAEVFRAP